MYPTAPQVITRYRQLVWVGCLLVGNVWAQSTPLPPQPSTPVNPAALAAAAAAVAPATSAMSAANAPSASPASAAKATPSGSIKGQWRSLTLAQQQALEPLAPHWSSLSESQKNKWLAISKNFVNLPDYEKSTMHSRMAEWATLTPQQRTQARLNFGETNRIPQVEKKAQWQAYQSLSEEEKRKWVSTQQPPVMGAALAPKPAAPEKLSHVQSPSGQPAAKGKTPGVKDLDQKTLLPPPKVPASKVDATPA